MRISRIALAAIVLTTGALGVAVAQQKPAAPSATPTVITVYKTPT